MFRSQEKGTHDIGLDEFTRTMDRAVDVALSGEIDHSTRTVLGQQLTDPCSVTDIALHKDMPPIALQTGEVLQIARIGELVEIDDGLVVSRQPVKNEIRADKSSAACNHDAHVAITPLACCV